MRPREIGETSNSDPKFPRWVSRHLRLALSSKIASASYSPGGNFETSTCQCSIAIPFSTSIAQRPLVMLLTPSPALEKRNIIHGKRSLPALTRHPRSRVSLPLMDEWFIPRSSLPLTEKMEAVVADSFGLTSMNDSDRV